MREQKITSFKIASAYIGTIIGAGFATGQEILIFFSIFELKGLISLLLSTLFFIIFGFIVLAWGYKLNAASYKPVIEKLAGQKINKIFDCILIIFLIGAFAAMLAGTGAIFLEQLKLNFLSGSIFMMGLTFITVTRGLSFMVDSVSFIVPIIIVGLITLSVLSLIFYSPAVGYSFPSGSSHNIPNYALSGILYTSYNILLAFGVLIPLGAQADKIKDIKKGAFLGGIGLGISILAVYIILSLNDKQNLALEVPMIGISKNLLGRFYPIYLFITCGEIYTTAVSNLYGITSRFAKQGTNSFYYWGLAISIVGLLIAQSGFSNIIENLYPVMGYSGLILLIFMIIASQFSFLK